MPEGEDVPVWKKKPLKAAEKPVGKKIPKWKQQSMQLRQVVGSGKEQVVQALPQDDLLKCQFCSRSFNQQAAERHIPLCEKKAKLDKMKRSSKPIRASTLIK